MRTSVGLSDWLVDVSGPTVVIDLSGLTFMDSTGISALVTARNLLTKEDNDLIVTRPGPIVRRTLEIVGLTSWVKDWDPAWEAADVNDVEG